MLMHGNKTSCFCSCSIFIFPNNIFHKVYISKNLFLKHFELSLFVIINGYKNHAFVAQKSFGNSKAFVHKTQPFRVAVRVFFIHKGVVILKIFVTSVIRRVNVNDINFVFVRKCESRKGMEVVAFNEGVVKPPSPQRGSCLFAFNSPQTLRKSDSRGGFKLFDVKGFIWGVGGYFLGFTIKKRRLESFLFLFVESSSLFGDGGAVIRFSTTSCSTGRCWRRVSSMSSGLSSQTSPYFFLVLMRSMR